MFKCLECGCEFEQPVEWMENGVQSACPNCGGDYEEMVKCSLCGEWHTEEEMYQYEDICKNCIEDYLNPKDIVTIGVYDEYEVKLNGFLTSVFTESEINEILLNEFKKLTAGQQRKYTADYVEEYPDAVAWAFKKAMMGGDL